ncbi:MAG TPA: dynamin family protein [Micromonosporaceae bacterium]|nr:dynamin family protein [Micromonosporaceae bacterium]
MEAGPLSARVGELCDEVAHQLGAGSRARVRDVRARLGEPLRVAIAGRLKAGKSTLVNALIGRRVAPTEVGECTRVVTRFRYGSSDCVDVVRRGGARISLPLDEAGMVPQRLGVPRDEIAYVDVTLTSDRLRDLTVLDTPGLSSVNAAVSARARGVLTSAAPIDELLDPDSAGALSGAEAVLYVFTQVVRADDVAALESFQQTSARLSSSPINSLGVLTKVDKLVPGGVDPWPIAERIAHDQAGVLRRVVSEVVPVVGLLAETTRAGLLTVADCAALGRLAGLPPAERAILLASADLFTTRDCPVPPEVRARLLRLLDLYGVSFAIAALIERPQLASGELIRGLLQASGLDALRQLLDTTLRRRTDALKAGWALSSLARIAGHTDQAQDRETLRDALDRALRQPEYHRLRLLQAAQLVGSGTVDLPTPMVGELNRLAISDDPGWILDLPATDPDHLARAALAAAARWRAYAVGEASPAQSRVALVGHRGLYLLAQRLRARPEVP